MNTLDEIKNTILELKENIKVKEEYNSIFKALNPWMSKGCDDNMLDSIKKLETLFKTLESECKMKNYNFMDRSELNSSKKGEIVPFKKK